MKPVLEILEPAVLLFVDLLGYVLLIRCLLPLLAKEDGKLMEFCYAVSEPVVAPVRNVLNRIPALGDSGIDFSYMATYLILLIVKLILLSVS